MAQLFEHRIRVHQEQQLRAELQAASEVWDPK